MKLNRFQAFGFHLLGSVIGGLCISALVFLVWYRWPLPLATGVTDIFLMLLAVDVVIGPCITLIVFNTAKKELKRDLAVILLLQICAMLWGMHALFGARPVYMVYNVDRFDLVYANDLTDEKLSKVSDPKFRSLPIFGTDVIAARSPDTAKDRDNIMFNAAKGGDDLPQLPQYYVPYAQLKSDAQKRIHSLEELKLFNPKETATVDALVGKYASVPGGVGFLALRGKVLDMSVVVRKDSADELEVVNLRPWH